MQETIFQRIEEKLDHALRNDEKILKVLCDLGLFDPDESAQSAVLQICVKGENMGANLSVKLTDTPGVASLAEFSGLNGSGSQVQNVGPVSFKSDNPAVATVDPVTGQLAYVGGGVANISAVDSGNGLSDSAQLTVDSGTTGGGTAQSAVLTLTPGSGALPAVGTALSTAAAVDAAHAAAAKRALASR